VKLNRLQLNERECARLRSARLLSEAIVADMRQYPDTTMVTASMDVVAERARSASIHSMGPDGPR
jgi:hypothetical protein